MIRRLCAECIITSTQEKASLTADAWKEVRSGSFADIADLHSLSLLRERTQKRVSRRSATGQKRALHCLFDHSLALRKPWKARARYLLKIAAVAYLRKLDELHGDRSARLVEDQALAVQPTLVETSHRYVRASRRKSTFEFAPRLLENGVEKELLDTGCRNRIFLEKCALVRDH